MLLRINFKGVLIIKHAQPEGYFNMDLSSFYKSGFVISSTKSIGFRPLVSFISRDDPLINKDLTGLVLLKVSTLFTARCNGV